MVANKLVACACTKLSFCYSKPSAFCGILISLKEVTRLRPARRQVLELEIMPGGFRPLIKSNSCAYFLSTVEILNENTVILGPAFIFINFNFMFLLLKM